MSFDDDLATYRSDQDEIADRVTAAKIEERRIRHEAAKDAQNQLRELTTFLGTRMTPTTRPNRASLLPGRRTPSGFVLNEEWKKSSGAGHPGAGGYWRLTLLTADGRVWIGTTDGRTEFDFVDIEDRMLNWRGFSVLNMDVYPGSDGMARARSVHSESHDSELFRDVCLRWAHETINREK